MGNTEDWVLLWFFFLFKIFPSSYSLRILSFFSHDFIPDSLSRPAHESEPRIFKIFGALRLLGVYLWMDFLFISSEFWAFCFSFWVSSFSSSSCSNRGHLCLSSFDASKVWINSGSRLFGWLYTSFHPLETPYWSICFLVDLYLGLAFQSNALPYQCVLHSEHLNPLNVQAGANSYQSISFFGSSRRGGANAAEEP